jgi:hypothetical protein
LHQKLIADLRSWNSEYEEFKLPIDGEGDPDWVSRGVELLARTRAALAGRAIIVVTEPWWGEMESDG